MSGHVTIRFLGVQGQVVAEAAIPGETIYEWGAGLVGPVILQVDTIYPDPPVPLTAIEHLRAALELLGDEPPEWED